MSRARAAGSTGFGPGWSHPHPGRGQTPPLAWGAGSPRPAGRLRPALGLSGLILSVPRRGWGVPTSGTSGPRRRPPTRAWHTHMCVRTHVHTCTYTCAHACAQAHAHTHPQTAGARAQAGPPAPGQAAWAAGQRAGPRQGASCTSAARRPRGIRNTWQATRVPMSLRPRVPASPCPCVPAPSPHPRQLTQSRAGPVRVHGVFHPQAAVLQGRAIWPQPLLPAGLPASSPGGS